MSDERVQSCHCCNRRAKVSVILATGIDATGELKRYYLPNQYAREHGDEADILRELWFCHPCIRMVEDTMRAVIYYLIIEGGPKFRATDDVH